MPFGSESFKAQTLQYSSGNLPQQSAAHHRRTAKDPLICALPERQSRQPGLRFLGET